MNYNVARTQGIRMLGGVVLVHPFEAEGLARAAVAVEDFLLERLRKRLDLVLKDPLHVLQSQLLCERPLWWVYHWLLANSLGRCRVAVHPVVEPLADVNQGLGSKSGAVLLANLVATVPAVSDVFINVTDNLSTERSLNFLPLLIDGILGCLGTCQGCFKMAG
jgi:hypothetical protein